MYLNLNTIFRATTDDCRGVAMIVWCIYLLTFSLIWQSEYDSWHCCMLLIV